LPILHLLSKFQNAITPQLKIVITHFSTHFNALYFHNERAAQLCCTLRVRRFLATVAYTDKMCTYVFNVSQRIDALCEVSKYLLNLIVGIFLRFCFSGILNKLTVIQVFEKKLLVYFSAVIFVHTF